MLCPKCLSTTYVIDTRCVGRTIRRRRACESCNYRFNTDEIVVDVVRGQPPVYHVQTDAVVEKGVYLCK